MDRWVGAAIPELRIRITHRAGLRLLDDLRPAPWITLPQWVA